MNIVTDFLDDVISHCTALGMPPKRIILCYELYDVLKYEINPPFIGIHPTYLTDVNKYMDIDIIPRIEKNFIIKVETE